MKISHLITTYNRGTQLERSLKRLESLTLPDELVVVDDGSTNDRTSEVVHLWAGRTGVPLRYTYRAKSGYDVCAIPRNIGIKQCAHDFILISEPEVIFVTDVIAQLRECVKRDPNFVYGSGKIYFTNPETPVNDLIWQNPASFLSGCDLKMMPLHEHEHYNPDGTRIAFTGATVTYRENLLASWCVLYHRPWLMEIGGWDEDMSLVRGGGGYGFDDTDLMTRLRIKGWHHRPVLGVEIIHQWHDRPPAPVSDGWARNEEIMRAKKLNEDPSNLNLVANRGREWGVG